MTVSSVTDASGHRLLGPFEIFGRTTEVWVDRSRAGNVLQRELSIYPVGIGPATRVLRVTHEPAPTGGLVNPGLHTHLEDGFVARYPNAAVQWRFSGATLAESVLHAPPPIPGLRGWRSRWRSIQYADSEEMVGQTLHELALVPSVYFEDELVPVHASAFAIPGLGMVLIGGAGGVGKTTLEVDLCLRHGAAFAADDIAMLDRSGTVYPNLAYPKIYGYNLVGDPELAKRVFMGATPANRLQWRWRRWRVGPSRVRRRVAPDHLYPSVVTRPEPLRRYLILARDDRASLAVEQISAERAADISVRVLDREYEAWHRHLALAASNSASSGVRPQLLPDVALEAFRMRARHALQGVDCRVVHVPVKMPHRVFRRDVAAVVMA